MQCTRICTFFAFLLAVSGLLRADDRASADDPAASLGLERKWSASMQTGFTPTFQMTLGGTFGDGPDWANKMVLSLHNAVREGDSVSVFGWNTLDLGTPKRNWMSGLLYRVPVLQRRRHTLLLGGGMERWLLPSVKSGARDWLASGYLSYATAVKKVPIIVTQDSWSLLRSTLPTGSVLFTQIQTQQSLFKREQAQVALRHGVQHTYSWGFYGAQGNRVVRYGASLVLTWKKTTFESGYRQQFGLQDGIRYNRFWTFSVTRKFAGVFH